MEGLHWERMKCERFGRIILKERGQHWLLGIKLQKRDGIQNSVEPECRKNERVGSLYDPYG